ncbi:MAG: hypothetical protein JXA73_13325 [Acidobacteria bacterium]|nr:hypothetical protein [Acidobacteriota bacterium]
MLQTDFDLTIGHTRSLSATELLKDSTNKFSNLGRTMYFAYHGILGARNSFASEGYNDPD